MTCYETFSVIAQFSILGVTVIYAIFAGAQWCAIRQQTTTTDTNLKTIHRAYLNASPRPPQETCVEVEIRNFGETPATITAIAIQCETKLPQDLDSMTPVKDFSGYYLVKTEWFFWKAPLPEDLRGTSYFLVGYIDYVTEFKECRRFSFARQYVPDPERPRFVFVPEGGLNKDRPRKKHEG